MKISSTLINYYIHCKRQCYLHGNRINLEDNSEKVKIGKALHEEKALGSDNTEIAIQNIRIDKLTKEYLTELKKSDADVSAGTWQLLYNLMILKRFGIHRKGRLVFIEKNKIEKKTIIVELTDEKEEQLNLFINEIENLLLEETAPNVINEPKCNACAYYEYCYI